MKRLHAHYGCPVELALEFVGGEWKTVILAWLKEAPHRYGELRTRIPTVSDKVPSERLRDLERLGLVEKRAAPPGHVYHLTARSDSLRPVLESLYVWGETVSADLNVEIRAAMPD